MIKMRGEASKMDTRSSGCADKRSLIAVMGRLFDVPPTVVFTVEIIRSK